MKSSLLSVTCPPASPGGSFKNSLRLVKSANGFPSALKTVQLVHRSNFRPGVMVHYLRYLLTPVVLVTLLWTSTFLHDFCEVVLATAHDTGHHQVHVTGHHHHHGHHAAHSLIAGSSETHSSFGCVEDHGHQPSLFSNHRSDQFKVAHISAQPKPIVAQMLISWQAGQPVIVHSRQRPPPDVDPTYKLPTYLRYQVLLI